MKLTLKALGVAVVANGVLVLPFLLFHRESFHFGILAVVIVISALLRPQTPGIGEEWAVVFPVIFPVLILIFQAIFWSIIHHEKTGSLVPDSPVHWLALIAAPAGFALLVWLSATMRRRSIAEDGKGSN